jgi:hypothetical protein
MASLNRLTTLERTKDWIGVTTSNDDVFLTRLVDEVSRFILTYLQRPTLFQNGFTDIIDGTGHKRQTLRHWPVTAVSSVTVDGNSISAISSGSSTGFTVDAWDGLPPGTPQAVTLRGYHYCSGLSNVNITYTAGFSVTNEPQTVPASGNHTVAVNAPHGNFGEDQGVTYANGTSLAKVVSNPGLGQYTASAGIYGFSQADGNANIFITYSYVPADIEHACVELIGERYRYKNRIGEISKSLGGQETMSFSQKDMPDYVRLLLQPYRRVVLV